MHGKKGTKMLESETKFLPWGKQNLLHENLPVSYWNDP